MSTPPSTETFVTGDRFIYKISGRTYLGTILRPSDYADLYRCNLDTYGDHVFVLPSVHMTKLELSILPAKLSEVPSLGDFKARLSEVSSTLEKALKDVSDEMENTPELGEYAFDAGFTAGLRVALNELAKLSESL